MKHGELYRVRHPKGEPKRSRIFCIASRAALIGSSFSTVTRAPIYSARHGLSIQVLVGLEEGLKHGSTGVPFIATGS